jgi:hypothetical protein
MARRSASFQELFLNTLGQVGPAAMQAGKLVGDTRRADAENTRADTESKARVGLVGEQTRGAKTTADASALDYDKALREDTLRKSLGSAASERDAAQAGTPTKDGHAVDFQTVKKANRGFEQADANLWNNLNPGSPMGAESLKAKRERDEAGEVLAADEKTADATRKQEKHKSDLETAEATRLSGRYSPITLEGGSVGKFNTKTGDIEDTGQKALPKPAHGGDPTHTVLKPGETLVPGLKEIPGVQITKDSVQKVKAAYSNYTELKNQLQQYQDLYSKMGTEMVGEGADQLDAISTGMQLTLKELQNLGVLNGPDLMLMLKQIPTAAGVGAKVKGIAYGAVGADPVAPKLKQLDTFIENRFKTHARANGFEVDGAAPTGAGTPPAAGGLDTNDPKVKAALEAGYTEDEIRAHLGKGR